MKFKISTILFAVLVFVACKNKGKHSGHDHDSSHSHDTETSTNNDTEDKGPTPIEASENMEGKVFFVNLKDGDKVKSPVKVEMGVEGMEIEPANELNVGKGHHHIVVDGTFIEKGKAVPADATHIHYGKGQTETELELEKGTHTLTLQLADGYHQSYGEKWSTTITIEVE